MELSNTQKKFIRSEAQKIKSTIQIGKNEISDNLFKTIQHAIDANELIKVHVLANAAVTKQEAVALIQEELQPAYIYTIGNQVVIFNTSTIKDKRVLSKIVTKK